MLHLLPKIFAAIGALLGAMSCYYTVYAIVGLFATRRFAPARRQHRYAIVIAARNEEAAAARSAMSAATRTTAQRATRWNICSPASRGTTERMPLRAILYLTQTTCSTATMSRA